MRFIRSTLLNKDLSVLAFGSASVLGRSGRRDSLQSLSAAYDGGINLFDTARSYGYGEAEGLLGEFLVGRRSEVVITSKFGIVPAAQSILKRTLKPLARTMMRYIPGVSRAVRTQLHSQFNPGQFTVETLRSSVETSLRKLRTDYLDVLLMHDANAAALAKDDVLRAMEGLVTDGKVRLLGVSAEPEVAAAAVKLPALRAVQYPSNMRNGFPRIQSITSVFSPVLCMANQPFDGGKSAADLKKKLEDNNGGGPEISSALRQKLESGDGTLALADLVLNVALAASDVVVASMMSPAHLRTNLSAISDSRFDQAEIEQLRHWLVSPNRPLHHEAKAFGS